uniref:Putative secreted protein n=1 Tax=Anopheles darlingi TaxID=43151 RepID=A0A2M4DJ07_ANODA
MKVVRIAGWMWGFSLSPSQCTGITHDQGPGGKIDPVSCHPPHPLRNSTRPASRTTYCQHGPSRAGGVVVEMRAGCSIFPTASHILHNTPGCRLHPISPRPRISSSGSLLTHFWRSLTKTRGLLG